MQSAIQVHNLSKRFVLGQQTAGRYGTLRDSLMNAMSSAARRLSGRGEKTESRELMALNDVSFDIQPGEAVGIIGRNGAGKSTLLKILSRITPPSKGSVRLRGRVGSLLEVGTGFHQELTGRENVFLNGAIIGMPRKEIARKFDAIVDFAEIEKFIDTPVKRYSSGMYVRLAFAVAAHLEPDILLLDEVLSVGDLAFQRKCMDHAKRLRQKNVTLLLVSHNMFAIKAMCTRAIYLSGGKVAMDGATEEVTRHYDQENRMDVAGWAQSMVGSDPTKCPIYFTKVEVMNEAGTESAMFDHGQRLRVRLHYHARRPVANPNFNMAIIRSDETCCCNYNTAMDGFPTGVAEGPGSIELLTPPLKLVAELYSIQVLAWDAAFKTLYCAQTAKNFHVRDAMLSTEFGVFHESAEWSRPQNVDDANSSEPVLEAVGSLV